MLNTELWSEYPPERYIEQEFAIARQAGVPLIVSLGYTAAEIADLAPRVRPFADAIELSTHYIGDDPRPMVDAIRAAKAAVDVPVLVKFSPFRDVRQAALAAQEAGADGIVAVNSYGPCLGIDIETGMPLMGSQEGYGWLSGEAIKGIALRCVFDIAKTVDIPIFGVGGIRRGTDVIEFVMAGATAVQVCTAAILEGPSIYGKIVTEVERWLTRHRHESLEAIRGLAVRNVESRQVRQEHVPPTIDLDRCIGCGQCVTSCVYHALELTDTPGSPQAKVRLRADRCWGCGLCATRCPARALLMAGVSPPN
jgi:dihydroorotate dehydrogenase subfamily 1